MIRKTLLSICFMTVFFACKQPPKQSSKSDGLVTVKLSGQLKGKSPEEPLFLIGASSIEKLTLDKEKKFSKTLQLKKGLYRLLSRRVYLTSGFDLNIVQDDQNKPYVFTGKGAKENELLVKINQEALDLEIGEIIFGGLLTKPASDFWKKLNAFSQMLENQLSDTTLNKEFVEIEKQDIKYIAKNMAETYLFNYGLEFIKETGESKKTGKTLSQEEKNKLKRFIDQDVILNDEKLLAVSAGYRDFLRRQYLSNIHVEKKGNAPIDYTLLTFIAIDKTFQNERIKEYFWYREFSDYLMVGADKFVENNYAAYKKRAKNPEFIQNIDEIYQNIARSFKGENPPDFNYEEMDGDKISLSSLRGNYVYIDVWATWCGPCRAEQPFFDRIQKRYKNKPIRFVAISVDQQKDKWKKYVVDHRMKGVQLIADDNFNSEFIRFFQIKAIPRFILLDKEGRVIDPNAPRPSDSELKKLFSSLGL